MPAPPEKQKSASPRKQLLSGYSDPAAIPFSREHHGGSHGNYMLAKKQKLAEQEEELRRGMASRADGAGTGASVSAAPSSAIFAGCRLYINGYVEPSIELIKEMMAQHGGSVEQYLSLTKW